MVIEYIFLYYYPYIVYYNCNKNSKEDCNLSCNNTPSVVHDKPFASS